MKKTRPKPNAHSDASNAHDGDDATIKCAAQDPQTSASAQSMESINPDKDGGDAASVESLQERIALLEQSVLRAKADYQNLVRRSVIEKSDAIQFANANLMKSLLAVLDDFERSIESADRGDDPSAVLKGLRLVYENLCKGLTDHGLQSIEAVDQPFDPHLHEAMLQQPCDDRPGGIVITEIGKGYKLGDRVLRPSKVVVSKAIQESAKPENENRIKG